MIGSSTLRVQALDWRPMDANREDEQLMREYQRGDSAAFERLYARHKGGVYRFFLRQCDNHETAEELYQDVWIKLINARKSYKNGAKFTTWLYTIARNHLVDHYRKQAHRNSVSADQDQVDASAAPDNWQPDNEFERKRLGRALKTAVNNLPREQAEVFLMKQESGLSAPEIAKVQGITLEAAKSRYRYATRKLRAQLEQQRYEHE